MCPKFFVLPKFCWGGAYETVLVLAYGNMYSTERVNALLKEERVTVTETVL